MIPARQPSAAILKLSGDVHGWKNVVLRETNFVDGAYLVKVDGVSNENNKKEQVQILFTERDAADLSHTLEIHLLKRESGKQALKLTRDIHAINSHTSAPAPEPDHKAPICENCGLDNTTCRMDMAGCLQAQNAAAKAERELAFDDLIRAMDKRMGAGGFAVPRSVKIETGIWYDEIKSLRAQPEPQQEGER